MVSSQEQIASGDTSHKLSTLKRWTASPWIQAVFVFLLAAAVRLPYIGRDYPLGFDDGVYAASVHHVATGMSPFRDVFSSQGPYFLEIIALPARFAHNSSVAPRLIPFIAGCLVAVCTLVLARRFMPPGWAFFCSLIVAASGTLLRTTTPITSDGILALCVVICVLLAYRLCESPRIVNAVILGITLGIACGIKSIFMIPTLVFLVAITWKLSIKLRAIIVGTSLAVFALPFIVFGISRVIEQSVLYHLGKDESLSLSSNINKFGTTFGQFDIELLILFTLAVIISTVSLIRNHSREGSFVHRLVAFITPDVTQVRTLFIWLLVPTFALMLIQTPIFRNHLAALVVPMALYSCWVLSQHMRTRILLWIGVSAVALTIISLMNLSHNGGLSISGDKKKAIAVISSLNSRAVVLTDEPGLVIYAHRNVPSFFEDTSRYRFLSKRTELSLNEQDYTNALKHSKVCAIADSPIQSESIVDLASVVPDSWIRVHSGAYKVWINPAMSCQK